MKKIFLLLFLTGQALFAQNTFYKQYGQGQVQSGIGSSCVHQTFDGGYIMLGFIYPNNSDAQVYLVKTNPAGDTLWTKIIGGNTGFYMGTFVQQTSDSGYVVTGTYQAGSIYIIRTNNVGDTLWTKHYDNNSASVITSVVQTPDSGFAIVSTKQVSTSRDVYFLRTDKNGDTLWTKTYGGASDDFGYSIQQTSDGGYIIGGETWSNTAGSSDAYLIKTDVNGDTLWTKKYGGASGEVAHEVRQTSDGGYIIVGGNADIYVVKTDANGAQTWQHTFGGISHDDGFSVKQTVDGGYIIGGQIDHFSTAISNYVADACLLKINSAGNQQWNRNFGPLLGNPVNSYGNFVCLTSDGGYALTGNSGQLMFDYIIKTDSLGNIAPTGFFQDNAVENNFSFLIYPNPANGIFTIDLQEKTNQSQLVEIFNALGEKIYSANSDSQKQIVINLSGSPQGIYFVKIHNGERIEMKKIVIQ